MMRVVLVEDNALNAELATDLLQASGHGVTVATSAAAFRAILDGPRAEIVLMDIRLPDGDGAELLRELRARQGWERVPVIAMTAHALTGDRQRFLDVGFADVVTKPIETRDFVARIANLAKAR